MEFAYRYNNLATEKQKMVDINSSASRLYAKLSSLDIDSIGLSEYIKKYFKLKLGDLKHSLELASYTLSWSLGSSDKRYEDFHFIEYGAGVGLTCLLAKELGLVVSYNDIYDISLNDAMRIAQKLDCPADHYIQGDINEVIDFLRTKKIGCNAIASTDVIEHIYNIDDFFNKLGSLPGDAISIVMSSGANPYHTYIRRKLMNKQVELENVDRKKEYGHKERDTLKAYKSIRREIIANYIARSNISLGGTEFKTLVENTRGMNKEDIFLTVDRYLQTGKLPPSPGHSTNTCDPYTGNWAEHLMNPNDLKEILKRQGFKASVIAGFYGDSPRRLRRYAGKILDRLIYSNILGNQALRLAPFYTIYGHKDLLQQS